jgi:CheY-like chemotaxis protein
MHALVIEDEPLIAMAIEDVLKACGFKSFDFAVSAQAALDAASRRCPDLITSDVKLNPGCGIEAVQSICSRTEIPVVFITGNGTEARLRSPDHRVLDKPFDDEALTAAVSAALASVVARTSRS